MITITDEFMLQMLGTTRPYCIVILRDGPNKDMEGRDKIVWEHGRRNFSLRAQGSLSIVCPIRDESDIHGIGIFNATVEEVREIMEGDPTVQAGIVVYEIHPTRSFPGDSLPKA